LKVGNDVMGYKNEVVERLCILQQEAGLNKHEFKKLLAEVTGKTPRTLRRWYAFETIIQDTDLKKIALHFGQHENWLKFGDVGRESMIDQIMISNHFGVVIMKDSTAESMNHKFIEMMDLNAKNLNEAEACKYILNMQPEETVGLCDISGQLAQQRGSHHHTMVMIMGDNKQHTVEVTTLNINHGRVLRIIVDKGLVS
jgi:hypothetical protein